MSDSSSLEENESEEKGKVSKLEKKKSAGSAEREDHGRV